MIGRAMATGINVSTAHALPGSLEVSLPGHRWLPGTGLAASRPTWRTQDARWSPFLST
jgi:hypothetical protein